MTWLACQCTKEVVVTILFVLRLQTGLSRTWRSQSERALCYAHFLRHVNVAADKLRRACSLTSVQYVAAPLNRVFTYAFDRIRHFRSFHSQTERTP
jgi:hypothetical protein